MIENKSRKGPPNTYTTAVIEEIVRRLNSGERITRICRDEGMPAYRTVWEWRHNGTSPNAIAFREMMLGRGGTA